MRSPARQRAIVAAIKQAREDAGLTQRQLSERLGRASNYMSKLERLQTRVSVVEFIEIAGACDVDPRDLFAKVLR